MTWRITIEKERRESERKGTPVYGARIYTSNAPHAALKAAGLHASLTAARQAMDDIFGPLLWANTPTGAGGRLEAVCTILRSAR
jgi:hypothetical protein